MKKFLLSILLLLGLFIIGCDKSEKNEIKEEVIENFDKGRPKLEVQDVEVIFEDHFNKIILEKNKDTILIKKQIVVIPADEIEEEKLFEKASKSKEEFKKYFPDFTYYLDENNLERFFNVFKEDKEFRKIINLENSYENYLNYNSGLYLDNKDEELAKYMSSQEFENCRNLAKGFSVGNINKKIERFNFFLKYHT
jgi:lipoprotein